MRQGKETGNQTWAEEESERRWQVSRVYLLSEKFKDRLRGGGGRRALSEKSLPRIEAGVKNVEWG